jgi:hypothetical protein
MLNGQYLYKRFRKNKSSLNWLANLIPAFIKLKPCLAKRRSKINKEIL